MGVNEFPDDPGGSVERHAPRLLNFEDALNRQLDRIAYLRSMGHPWDEALYQLRDMVVGFEDKQFWDGVPPGERVVIEGLPDVVQRGKAAKRFEEDGWATMHVRAFRTSHGVVFRPTAEEMSRQLRVVLRLLDRCGMIRKTRTESRLPGSVVSPDYDPQ